MNAQEKAFAENVKIIVAVAAFLEERRYDWCKVSGVMPERAVAFLENLETGALYEAPYVLSGGAVALSDRSQWREFDWRPIRQGGPVLPKPAQAVAAEESEPVDIFRIPNDDELAAKRAAERTERLRRTPRMSLEQAKNITRAVAPGSGGRGLMLGVTEDQIRQAEAIVRAAGAGKAPEADPFRVAPQPSGVRDEDYTLDAIAARRRKREEPDKAQAGTDADAAGVRASERHWAGHNRE